MWGSLREKSVAKKKGINPGTSAPEILVWSFLAFAKNKWHLDLKTDNGSRITNLPCMFPEG